MQTSNTRLSQEIIRQDDWQAVKKFTQVFGDSINSEDDFNESCKETFRLAIKACQEERWVQLAGFSEMEKLSRCWKISLLNYAIEQGEDDWTFQLIKHNIDIHSKDFEGNTPMHIAARKGGYHLIKNHLFGHFNIDEKNNKKQTPLHVAIESGYPQIVAYMVSKNANINLPLPLSQSHLKVNAVALAASKGQKACLDELIKSPECNLDLFYEGFGSLLHVAIYFHQFEILKHLLNNHKTFNIEYKNHKGLTPLSFAASLDEQEAIQILYDHKASLETEDCKRRTPMHHAASKCHYGTIRLLASLGATINPDRYFNKRPYDLVKILSGDLAKSCTNLLYNLNSSNSASELSCTPQMLPPNNLAFRGGGAKCLSFVGVLAELEKNDLLAGVERLAGTSGGAITASLAAINYPIKRLRNLLQTTDLMSILLDHPLSMKRLEVVFENASLSSVLETLSYLSKIYSDPSKIISPALKMLFQSTGICKGEEFKKWLEDKIFKETGIAYFTFGDLAKAIENGKPYKHLYIFATKLGENPEIVQFDSNNPKWKDVIISSAVGASAAYPILFEPVVIDIRKDGKPKPCPKFGKFLDGGMLNNFPVETFDEKQFLTRENLGSKATQPQYNKRTWGYSLYSSSEEQSKGSIKTENLYELFSNIIRVYKNAENLIRQSNPYNSERVIEIDVKKIGTLSFNMPDSEKNELYKGGKKAQREFLIKNNMIKKTTSTTSKEPAPGLNITGVCKTEECRVNGKKILLQKDFGTFDLGIEMHNIVCPCCEKRVEFSGEIQIASCTFSYEAINASGEEVIQEKQKVDDKTIVIDATDWKYLQINIEK